MESSSKRIIHALVLVFFLMVMMAVSFIVLAPMLPGGPFQGTLIEFVGLIVLTAISAGGVVGFGLLRMGRISLLELGWRTDQLRRDVLLGVAGFVVLALFSLTLGTLAGFWTIGEFFETMASYTLSQRLLFVLIGLQAAFIEETVFRGYLQPALMAKLGIVGGLIVAALIFAVYHLNPRPITLFAKVVQGLIFGALRGRDRSLFAPATAHFLLWTVLGSL